jgi:hypothetical protein
MTLASISSELVKSPMLDKIGHGCRILPARSHSTGRIQTSNSASLLRRQVVHGSVRLLVWSCSLSIKTNPLNQLSCKHTIFLFDSISTTMRFQTSTAFLSYATFVSTPLPSSYVAPTLTTTQMTCSSPAASLTTFSSSIYSVSSQASLASSSSTSLYSISNSVVTSCSTLATWTSSSSCTSATSPTAETTQSLNVTTVSSTGIPSTPSWGFTSQDATLASDTSSVTPTPSCPVLGTVHCNNTCLLA